MCTLQWDHCFATTQCRTRQHRPLVVQVVQLGKECMLMLMLLVRLPGQMRSQTPRLCGILHCAYAPPITGMLFCISQQL